MFPSGCLAGRLPSCPWPLAPDLLLDEDGRNPRPLLRHGSQEMTGLSWSGASPLEGNQCALQPELRIEEEVVSRSRRMLPETVP